MVETDHRHTWLAYIHRVTSVLGAHTLPVKNLVDRQLGDPEKLLQICLHKPFRPAANKACTQAVETAFALLFKSPVTS
jgi:hypothetical protein